MPFNEHIQQARFSARLPQAIANYQSPTAGIAEKLLAIGEDTASRLHEPYKSIDHGDLLYDEDGLPG